jgi:hypothetical protein
MTNNRYTVEDPPEEGAWVWCANTCVGSPDLYLYRYQPLPTENDVLKSGCLHRTPESARAHARRMLMAHEILEAIEMLLRAQDSESPKWREHATRAARAVVAKARGEV